MLGDRRKHVTQIRFWIEVVRKRPANTVLI
jgi:hypothetical protein